MKKSEKSILGQRLAALRKKPHLNNGQFFSKMRREQERERKKLGIRFERKDDTWFVWRVMEGGDRYEGNVFKRGSHWKNHHSDSPHRTRLEAAKALLAPK